MGSGDSIGTLFPPVVNATDVFDEANSRRIYIYMYIYISCK